METMVEAVKGVIMNRDQVEGFIKLQFQNIDKKPGGCFHYGRLELISLLDFIFDDKERNKIKDLSNYFDLSKEEHQILSEKLEGVVLYQDWMDKERIVIIQGKENTLIQ